MPTDAERIKELEKNLYDERKKVAVLEQTLSDYENEPTNNGYYAVKRIVNQQIKYLQGFVIKDKISGKASEDATYARTKDMWEGLPKMISDLNILKRDLKISTEDEEKDNQKIRKPITPESMAQNLGDYKTQDV